MIADTNRRALRTALPWLFVGFLLLTFSIGLWLVDLVPADHWLAILRLGRAGSACGFLGSACFLVGLLLLSRAWIGARPSLALLSALALWMTEFALRVYSAASSPVDAADSTDVPSAPEAAVGLRLIVASGAMIALCSGMIWIWGHHSPRAPRAIWRSTRWFFSAQLLSILSLYVASFVHSRSVHVVFEELRASVPLGLGWPVVWLVFAGPFVCFFVALKETVAHTARRQSVADILTS